jgi:hypothetical protein
MKPLFILLIWLIPALDPPIRLKIQNDRLWSEEELRMANTAKNAKYLNAQEKDLVMYMNLARINGEKCLNNSFDEFFVEQNEQMVEYTK